MSDILSFLSSSWPSILGMGGGQSAAMPAAIPGSSGGFSPSGAVDGNALTPQQPTPQQNYNFAQQGWPTYQPDGQGFPAAQGGEGPMAAQASPAPAASPAPPAASPSVPLPTRPNMGAPSAPGMPMSLAPPNPGGAGMPLSLAPPNPGASTPPSNSNLAMLLGANAPTNNVGNAINAGMAALGKGLSTVGGNTAAGAFARGMGGALQGGTQYTQQQRAQNFNMASGYFKDMLAAKNADDVEGYRRAQAAYLNSRASAIQLGGGTGSGAWQNTNYGKTIQIENEAQKYEKGQQIILQKQWQLNGASPDQQQTDLDNLQKKVDGYRQRLYKSAGIDPSEGQKNLQYGTSQDTPFPTKGMTLDQFNEQVPMGAWFTDQNGDVRQRTVAPNSGAGSVSGTAAESNGQQMQDYYDTSMAMQPAQ